MLFGIAFQATANGTAVALDSLAAPGATANHRRRCVHTYVSNLLLGEVASGCMCSSYC